MKICYLCETNEATEEYDMKSIGMTFLLCKACLETAIREGLLTKEKERQP